MAVFASIIPVYPRVGMRPIVIFAHGFQVVYTFFAMGLLTILGTVTLIAAVVVDKHLRRHPGCV
jgi:hypothetical protein